MNVPALFPRSRGYFHPGQKQFLFCCVLFCGGDGTEDILTTGVFELWERAAWICASWGWGERLCSLGALGFQGCQEVRKRPQIKQRGLFGCHGGKAPLLPPQLVHTFNVPLFWPGVMTFVTTPLLSACMLKFLKVEYRATLTKGNIPITQGFQLLG